MFLIEISLASFAQKDYINSFFFWLDLIATISLIQEIDWIFTPLLNIGSSHDSVGTSSNAAAHAVAKATSAGRITRVLRVVRIIRLIRIVKLYKSAMQARKNACR